MTSQKRERIRHNITVALVPLSLYALSQKSPKEISYETKKSLKWIRRLLKKFR